MSRLCDIPRLRGALLLGGTVGVATAVPPTCLPASVCRCIMYSVTLFLKLPYILLFCVTAPILVAGEDSYPPVRGITQGPGEQALIKAPAHIDCLTILHIDCDTISN